MVANLSGDLITIVRDVITKPFKMVYESIYNSAVKKVYVK